MVIKKVIESSYFKMNPLHVFFIATLFSGSIVTLAAPIHNFKECVANNKLDLCSYLEDNVVKCDSTPLDCLIMEPGVCITRANQSCDATGLCYAELSFVDQSFTKVSTKNYFSPECSVTDFGFEQTLIVGQCTKVTVFNFTFYAKIDWVGLPPVSSFGIKKVPEWFLYALISLLSVIV